VAWPGRGGVLDGEGGGCLRGGDGGEGSDLGISEAFGVV
jgi:hypothetical protein